MMKKSDIDNLIGLSVEAASEYCRTHNLSLEFYPEEAKPTWVIRTGLIRFWHKNGIVSGWAPGNHWDIKE